MVLPVLASDDGCYVDEPEMYGCAFCLCVLGK